MSPAPLLLLPALSTKSCHGVQTDSRGRPSLGTELLLLGQFRQEGDTPAMYTRSTMQPVVHQVLADVGLQVRQSGQEPACLPSPFWSNLREWDNPDKDLLQLVQNCEEGLIHYNGRTVDLARLVALVALAWPEKTIAVVVRRLEDIREFRRGLRQHGVDAGLLSAKHGCRSDSRVQVGTPLGHADNPHDIAWLDIVIVPDALEATGENFKLCLGHAPRARLYGFLPVGTRPSPLEGDLLRLWFGFNELIIPGHGHRERVVNVVTHSITGGMPLPQDLGILQLKRRGIWHHAVRNRRLAQLAKEAAKTKPNDSDRVLVIVENVEHAIALAERLPGWPVWTADEINTNGFSSEQLQRLRGPSNPFDPPSQAIVTTASLPEVDLSEALVLIRGDGGVGLPPLRAEQLAEPDDGPVRPLRLVDLDDRHHAVLRRHSWQRQQAYGERGWYGPSVDPIAVRVEDYLAGRPKSRGR